MDTTPVNTPATSVAPSLAGGPKAKLPLVVRKNVRDVWETAKPDIEDKLSNLLGVPWKADIDVAHVYSFADSDYTKYNTGDMIKSYIEGALSNLDRFITKYGDEGKSELNKLASSHSIAMDITDKPNISYTGCEIANGVLRILFVKGELGTNVSDSLNNLSDAINEAGISKKSDALLYFDARSSIKNDYEPGVGAVKSKFETLLALPTIDLEPNFEANYAALLAYSKSGKSKERPLRSDWQKTLGEYTLQYFEEFVKVMGYKDFGTDDMLQEGFKDAVEKNQVALRVVEKLKRGSYNECVVENGVLYIQTTPNCWMTNIGDPAYGLIDIL